MDGQMDRCFTSYPNIKAMMLMSKPKKASNFLRPAVEESQSSDWLAVHLRGLITNAVKAQSKKSPYLSRKRKKNVSMIVMRTPAHKGILLSHTNKQTTTDSQFILDCSQQLQQVLSFTASLTCPLTVGGRRWHSQ